MNIHDKIITALTPGSVFNRGGRIFRSASNLAQFAGVDLDELVDLLAGENLAPLITCKPSAVPGKGILVALTANIPPPDPNEPVQIVAGNAIQPVGIEAELVDEDEANEADEDEDPVPEEPDEEAAGHVEII